MTAPVIGFSAEVDEGLNGGLAFIQIDPNADGHIEISLLDNDDDRLLIVTHDEARQIIAGLASVIT